jgi:hypothetical protein
MMSSFVVEGQVDGLLESVAMDEVLAPLIGWSEQFAGVAPACQFFELSHRNDFFLGFFQDFLAEEGLFLMFLLVVLPFFPFFDAYVEHLESFVDHEGVTLPVGQQEGTQLSAIIAVLETELHDGVPGEGSLGGLLLFFVDVLFLVEEAFEGQFAPGRIAAGDLEGWLSPRLPTSAISRAISDGARVE